MFLLYESRRNIWEKAHDGFSLWHVWAKGFVQSLPRQLRGSRAWEFSSVCCSHIEVHLDDRGYGLDCKHKPQHEHILYEMNEIESIVRLQDTDTYQVYSLTST